MIKPDPNDPIKVRRALAFFVSIYAFLVLPNLVVIYAAVFKSDTELLKHILNYVGILAAGPIGAYLYAAQTQGSKEPCSPSSPDS